MLGLIFSLILLPFRAWRLLTSGAALGIGIVYPALESFKAVESRELGDDTQWLTYWVVVCTLMVLEKLLWPVLMWIPLFSLFRVAGLAWLALPQTKGAKLMYSYLRPFLFAAVEKSREIPAIEPYLRSYHKAFSGKVEGVAPAFLGTAAASAAMPPEPARVASPDFDQLKKDAIAKVSETFEKAKAQAAEATGGAAGEEEPAYALKSHAQ